MPFSLTNALATFKALMNDILKPYIRHFVLVFFDDILIFSSSWAEHLQHVHIVLQQMRQHHLFGKRSKCFFGEPLVAYLRHIISAVGVAMDPVEVEAVEAWPRPHIARALRVPQPHRLLSEVHRGYSGVAGPLTALLKREAFSWMPEAKAAFLTLKTALISAPLLQLPDFSKCFIVDCDASGARFSAVLHQGDVPWLTSVALSQPTMPSSQPMSASSSGWSRRFVIGGPISGVVCSQSAQTIGVSSSSSTSA